MRKRDHCAPSLCKCGRFSAVASAGFQLVNACAVSQLHRFSAEIAGDYYHYKQERVLFTEGSSRMLELRKSQGARATMQGMKRHTIAITSVVLFGTLFLALASHVDREIALREARRAIGFLELGGTAHAATVAGGFKTELGVSGQVITNPTTPTFLTVPLEARHAWIHVKGNPACWSAGAVAPSATSGGEWPAGALLKFENDPLFLKALRVINCAEGPTTVKVYYTRDRRASE